MYSLNDLLVIKIEHIENELRELPPDELRQICEWLDDIMDEELELTPECGRVVQQTKRKTPNGTSSREHEQQRS